MSEERRRPNEHRITFEQRATLRTSAGCKIEILPKNLSRGGFLFDHDGHMLSVGEQVVLTSSRGSSATAEIRWLNATQAGSLFIDPVSPLS